MKIIADTNVWYYMGKDKLLFEKVKFEPISPTFINIYELARTENLIDKQELVRDAIRKFFNYKYEVIYEPPFIYIGQMNCDTPYDVCYGLKYNDSFNHTNLGWTGKNEPRL